MSRAATILRVTHHAASRLLERGGRADLQQALMDELRPSARSLLALARAAGGIIRECVALDPAISGGAMP